MKRKRKQKRRDSLVWKRFLDTILSLLPRYIQQYPEEDQRHLNDFCSILTEYNVDILSRREALSKRLDKFIQKHQQSEDYYRLPFLWFACRYFLNASQLLSLEGFYADKFYGYLVRFLRGDSIVSGAFQLIQEITPLTDLRWEQLQFASIETQVPLSREDLQVLEIIYSNMGDMGIYALSPRRIKDLIVNRTKSSRVSRILHDFLKMVDARWFILSNPAAFGLDHIYIQLSVKESLPLSALIDFNDPRNTVLMNSDIFSSRDHSDLYIGVLDIPTKMIDRLDMYLRQCVNEGQLNDYKLSYIETMQRSASFALYQPEEGWRYLKQSDRRRLTQHLKTQHYRKSQLHFPFYLTSSFNQFWNYRYHSHPTQIIKLYCKLLRYFSFEELPGRTPNTQFSKSELNLLKELLDRRAITIWFISHQLWYEFSLNAYWVTLPQMPPEQINYLLQWLPYSEIFFTDKNPCMRVQLTPDLVKWIKNDLEWPIVEIIWIHYPTDIKYEWYDPELHKWQLPSVLKI